jgi:hypothetical protein
VLEAERVPGVLELVVAEPDAGVGPCLAGAAGGGVLEPFGQPFGPLGGFVIEPGAHGAGDGEELRLDPARQAPGAAPAEEAVQARDGAIQAGHLVVLATLAPLGEVDD